ncbi:MAG: hypothetical protein ACWGSQ_03110 [Longimicrobiales bacterium]
MTLLAAGALALLLSACGAQTPDTTFVISSDPALRARVAELLPVLARRAGMELTRPIRAERRTREELEGYLRFKLDQEMPLEEATVRTRSYALLGMVPEDLDLRGLLISVYTEQVAGFYDPDSTALFVMDDMAVELLETVLVHELVHAVQDQTVNLDSLTAKERGNDRQVAAQSAIEGHATLVMLEHMAAGLGGEPVDISTLPNLSQSIRPALEAMREQYPVLASAPPIIQESLLFPYIEGASFVAASWQSVEGRPPPFWDLLPQSTEQILNPERAFPPEEDPPTELELTLDGGMTVAYENTLGQMELGVLLEEWLGEGHRGLAQGWDGDRFALLRSEADGADGLVWASVWDSEDQRDAFVSALKGGLGHLPLPTTLVATDVVGRPGALLRAGVAQGVEVGIAEGPPR